MPLNPPNRNFQGVLLPNSTAPFYLTEYPSGNKPEYEHQLTITSESSSKGFARFGLPFKRGRVIFGTSLTVKRDGIEVPCQFDKKVFYDDGSLKFCVASIRDTDFSSAESRVYHVEVVSGAFNNASQLLWSSVTGESSLNVQITNLTTSLGADSLGSTLECNLNAIPASRIKKTSQGAVCDEWKAWDLFESSGVKHPHLKAEYIITAWKDSTGNIVDIEFGAVLAQDWWAVADKRRLEYDATLRNGSTIIETYNGVVHPYHSRWLTIDKHPSLYRYGKRHWLSEPIALHVTNDNEAFTRSGLMLNYDLSADVDQVPNYNADYTPCMSMNHRASVDAGGAYMGRGMIPNSSVKHLITQSVQDARNERVNALAGLGITYHYRCEREANNDIVNTVIPVRLNPLKHGGNFDGLPEAQWAHRVAGNDAARSGGFVVPHGGTGEWVFATNDASHAVAYSYYQYLVSGETYLLDAVLSHGMNVIHQFNGNADRGVARIGGYGEAYRMSVYDMPDAEWEGVSQQCKGQDRAKGLALNLLIDMANTCPYDWLERKIVDGVFENHANYFAETIKWQPQKLLDLGLHYDYTTQELQTWAWGLFAQAIALTVNSSSKKGFREIAKLSAKFIDLHVGSEHKYAITEGGRSVNGIIRLIDGEEWSNTNDYIDFNQYHSYGFNGSVTSGSNIISMANVRSGLQYMNGDTIVFGTHSSYQNPAPCVAGTIYKIINANELQFSICELGDSTETPITFSESRNIWGWFRLQDGIREIATNPPMIPSQDSQTKILMAGAHALKRITPVLSDSSVTSGDQFIQNVSDAGFLTWEVK